MTDSQNRVRIDALFYTDEINSNTDSDPHPHSLIENADVIFGYDTMSRHEFLVYGKKSLKKMVKSANSRRVLLLDVELDQETDDLERLCALVEVIKGKHEYA